MEKGAEIEIKKIGYVKAVYTDTKEVAILPIDSIHGVKDLIKIKTKLYWTEIEDGADPKKIRKRTLVIINAGKTVDEMIKKEKVNASKREDTIPPARLIESASDNDDNQKLNSERLAKGSSTNKGLRMKQNIVVNRPDVNELLAKKKEQMHNKSFKQLYPEALATEKGIVPLKQAVVKIPETVKPVSTWKNYDLKNMDLTAYDRVVLEILIDVKKSIDDLTTRIEKIESIQIANTPKFADFIDQMASMKTTNASELTKLQTQYENILNIMNNRNIAQGPNSAELPSRETDNGREFHLGKQVYLPESVYDAVECDAKRKKSQYIRSLASAVYGIETLKSSSVHGEKGPKGEQARPRLDPTKKLAIEDTFVWWLQNRLSYSKEDSEAERDKVDDYLTRLIVDVRKTPEQREAKREYAKKHRDAKKKAEAELQTSKGKGEKSKGKRKADPISRNIRHFGEKQKTPHPLDTDSDEENTIKPSVSETREFKRIHAPLNSSAEEDDVSEAQENLENFESFTEEVDLDGLSDISQSAIDTDEEKNDEEIDNATSTIEDKDPLL